MHAPELTNALLILLLLLVIVLGAGNKLTRKNDNILFCADYKSRLSKSEIEELVFNFSKWKTWNGWFIPLNKYAEANDVEYYHFLEKLGSRFLKVATNVYFDDVNKLVLKNIFPFGNRVQSYSIIDDDDGFKQVKYILSNSGICSMFSTNRTELLKTNANISFNLLSATLLMIEKDKESDK